MMFREFIGGFLNISHAGSSAALASDPLDVAILDEVDRMRRNVGDEGDPIKQAWARVKNSLFRKCIAVSSPSTEGYSIIDPLYKDGTQEKWYVPCPSCGHFHELVWDNMKFKNASGERVKAHFVCPSCGAKIHEKDKMKIITAGKAVGENPNPKPGVRSGFINELYSPWRTWDELANDYERAKDKPEELKVFWNTVLGYLWRNKGDAPPWEQIHDLAEPYDIGTIPDKSIVLLTAFVDYQLADGGRLEVEIMGWNRRHEAWSIQHDILAGDSKWDALSEYLSRTWEHPNGAAMSLRGLGIDSGAGTKDVYKWAKSHPRDRVFTTKGASNFGAPALGAFKQVSYYAREKKKIGDHRVWMLGVSTLKIEFYTLLRLRPKGDHDNRTYPAGFIHHPQYPEEFFQQRTAERLAWSYSKSGMKRPIWEKPAGVPNEALDLGVGNRGVFMIVGAERFSSEQWDQLERQYGETPPPSEKKDNTPLFKRQASKGNRRPGRNLFGGADDWN